jgi:hypothetical protein
MMYCDTCGRNLWTQGPCQHGQVIGGILNIGPGRIIGMIEPQPQTEGAAYLTARDYIINLSKEDQSRLYQFMYDAYDHCRIYK